MCPPNGMKLKALINDPIQTNRKKKKKNRKTSSIEMMWMCVCVWLGLNVFVTRAVTVSLTVASRYERERGACHAPLDTIFHIPIEVDGYKKRRVHWIKLHVSLKHTAFTMRWIRFNANAVHSFHIFFLHQAHSERQSTNFLHRKYWSTECENGTKSPHLNLMLIHIP